MNLGTLVVRMALEMQRYKAELKDAVQSTTTSMKDAEKATADLTKATKGLDTQAGVAAEKLKDFDRAGQGAASGMSAASVASNVLISATSLLAKSFAAVKVTDLVGDMAMLSARYETMGVVMRVAGNNAGYTAEQMQGYANALQESGISMLQSRNAVTQLATANIDLAKASQLGRAAQDLAVVGNINSSEALGRLVQGIKSGEVEILRTMGLNVSFEGSYKRMAAQLGITTEQLSENQKMVARTNAALDEAARYNGIYAESMTTAGKAMTSLTRYWEDFKVKAGDAFLPTLATGVFDLTEALKEMNKELDEAGQSGLIDDVAQGLNGAFKVALQTTAVLAANVAFVLQTLGREIGGRAAQMVSFATGDWKGALYIGDELEKDAAVARSALDKFEQKVMGVGQTVKATALMTEAERIAAGAASKAASEAAEKEAAAAKARADAMKKGAAEYDKLMDQTRERIALLQAEGIGQDKLTEGQKWAIKVADDLTKNAKNMTDAQRMAVMTNVQAVLVQERLNEERDKYLKQNLAIVDALKKETDSVEQKTVVQERANATYGMSKAALEELVLAELEQTRAALEQTENVIPGYIESLERRIAAQKRLVTALREGDVLQANADAAKKAREEWERTAQSINQSITDGLMRGFENGKGFAKNLIDTIKNMFSTLVLRPVVQWAVGGLTGLGGTSAMANSLFSGSSGTGSMFGNLSSMFDKLGANVSGSMIKAGDYLATSSNDYAAKLGELMQSSASLTGSFARYGAAAAAGVGIGGMVSGQYSIGGNKNTATMLGTGIGALLGGPWGAVLGGALGGVANRAFGMGAKEVTSSGLVGTLSTGSSSLRNYTNWHQDGGWFRSDRSGTDYSAASGDLMAGLQSQIDGAHKAIDMWSGVLGGSFKELTSSININLAGLDEAARTAKVTEAITNFTNELVNGSVSIVAEFQKSGESLTDTLMRVGQSVKTATDTFSLLGVDVFANAKQLFKRDKAFFSQTNLYEEEAPRVNMQIVDKFGGIDGFSASTGAFFDSFYRASEQSARKTAVLTEKIAELGFAMPSTREEFRKLAEAQDLSSSAGQSTYAALLQLAPAFADVVPWIDATSTAADTLSKSLTDIAAAFSDAMKSLADEKLSLEQQLLQAQGNSAGAAQSARDNYLRKTTSGMSADQAGQVAAAYDYNRALEQQIIALNSVTQAESDRAASLAQIAQERYGLEGQLLQLQGNTIALRERELATLDPSNRALQENIYALQDKQAADAAQVQIQQQQASAAQQLADAWKSLGDSMQSEINRIRGLLVGGSTGGLAAMQADFAVNTAAARAGDQGAAGKLAGLSQAMLEAAANSVSTSEELARMQASTAASLEETMRLLGGRGVSAPTIPGFATGGDFAGGLRIVGENGPELEATGASRIFNATQTANMLGGGQDMVATLRALQAEVVALRAEVQAARADNTAENRALVEKTSRVAVILDDVTQGGTRIRTVESVA